MRVDSGGSLNGALLGAGLVSEISLLVHPVLVGGVEGRYWFGSSGAGGGRDLPLRLIAIERLAVELVWARYQAV